MTSIAIDRSFHGPQPGLSLIESVRSVAISLGRNQVIEMGGIGPENKFGLA